MNLEGSCHCGAVTWKLDCQVDGATACNCTVCRRYGVLWAYGYEEVDVVVAGPTNYYVRGRTTEFHFCATCGCVTHQRLITAGPEGRHRLAVNLRLSEPDAVAAIPIDHFDGLNSFEDLERDGKCVRDYWA